jgi:hypothetical protein
MLVPHALLASIGQDFLKNANIVSTSLIEDPWEKNFA